ncbi:Hsp33 family molecular chaperone HslO [Cupriavidus basilensis]
MLNRHAYPAPVRARAGRDDGCRLAGVSANLKFNGALVMQLHGDGPVRMLVVECLSDFVDARHGQTGRRREDRR